MPVWTKYFIWWNISIFKTFFHGKNILYLIVWLHFLEPATPYKIIECYWDSKLEEIEGVRRKDISPQNWQTL